MSIATDKARLDAAKTELKEFVEGNGIAVPAGTKMDGLVDLVKTIDTSENVEWGYFLPNFLTAGSEPYQMPFIVGMTWREWASTPLLIPSIESGYGSIVTDFIEIGNDSDVYGRTGAGGYGSVSIDGTYDGRVSADDTIINGQNYKLYVDDSGWD